MGWARTAATLGWLLLAGCAVGGPATNSVRAPTSAPLAPQAEPAPREEASPAVRPSSARHPAIVVLPVLRSTTSLAVAYDRKLYRQWVDADGDCQDARNEVLIAESTTPVTFRTQKKCEVASGSWTCAYTGAVVTDPKQLDVDHVVPLANAHASGADRWNAEERERYANALDPPEHLMAVVAGADRSKGARGPEDWLPAFEGSRCAYVRDWIRIKSAWSLSAAQRERDALQRYVEVCEAGGVPELARSERSPPASDVELLAPDELDSATKAIIQESLDAYTGRCACPYHKKRDGSLCGRSSANSRGGGDAPLCYPADVKNAEAKRP